MSKTVYKTANYTKQSVCSC